MAPFSYWEAGWSPLPTGVPFLMSEVLEGGLERFSYWTAAVPARLGDRQARLGTDRPASGHTGPPRDRESRFGTDGPASVSYWKAGWSAFPDGRRVGALFLLLSWYPSQRESSTTGRRVGGRCRRGCRPSPPARTGCRCGETGYEPHTSGFIRHDASFNQI